MFSKKSVGGTVFNKEIKGTSNNGRKKILARLVSGIVFMCVCTFMFSGCAVFPKEEEALAPPLVEPEKVVYDEMEVKKGNIEISVKGTATFESASLSYESFKYGVSYLKSINVKLGDKVKAGQVLAEQETDSLKNDLLKRQYKLQLDQLTYERIQNNLNNATDDKTKLDLNLQLEQQNINIQMDKIDAEEAQKSIDRSQLKASISGTVTYITEDLNPGDRITPNKNIITIADPNTLELLYTGNDGDKFNIGAKVDVDYNGKKYAGEVVKDGPNVPADASQTAKKGIKMKLDSGPADVVMGDQAYITLVLQKKENVIVIPSSELRKADGRKYVEMLDKGLRVQRNVETGLENATEVEIVNGLNEGEKILK
ncbi:MAG: hypothetical protein Q8930_09715 [Bacillota bacterium]|nr:hypothetical protein [Bacillota bacterium]